MSYSSETSQEIQERTWGSIVSTTEEWCIHPVLGGPICPPLPYSWKEKRNIWDGRNSLLHLLPTFEFDELQLLCRRNNRCTFAVLSPLINLVSVGPQPQSLLVLCLSHPSHTYLTPYTQQLVSMIANLSDASLNKVRSRRSKSEVFAKH